MLHAHASRDISRLVLLAVLAPTDALLVQSELFATSALITPLEA